MTSQKPADQPVEKDPEVPPAVVEPSPTKLTTRRAITDEEVKDSDWLPTPVERPYSEAITPAHREYLLAIGLPIGDEG